MHRSVGIGVAGGAALALVACASTRLNSTWKAPEAQPLNFAGQRLSRRR
jgi:hypothetical protein